MLAPTTTSPHPLLPLLSTPAPPPFIYYHHPYHSSTTSLPRLDIPHVIVDASTTSNPRGLYTAILRATRELVDDQHTQLKDVIRWDDFVRGLKSAVNDLQKQNGKGKGKALENGFHGDDVEMDAGYSHASTSARVTQFTSQVTPGSATGLVLILQHAEMLNKIMGSGWGVITRLSEMVSRLNLSVFLIIYA
jgi:hypothetical protein